MKKTIFMLCLVLLSCTKMQDIRKPEYKTTHELNVGYQEAYRLITTSLVNDCNLSQDKIQPMIYTDAGYAIITGTDFGHTVWSMDLKDAGQSKTRMEFYSANSFQQLYAQRIREHINKKVPGCFWLQ